MNDICYLSSKGTYKNVTENGAILTGVDFLPQLHLFVYGNVLEPTESKSPLFRCRDLIAYFEFSLCFPDKGVSRSKDFTMNDAIFYIKDKIGKTSDKLIIRVAVANFDDTEKNSNALTCLSSSLYKVLKKEISEQFGYKGDIIVYWDFGDDYCIFNKDSEVIDSKLRYDSYNNIVVLD